VSSGKGKSSFLSALTQTYAVQVIALLAGIILLKILAGILSKEDMGAYLVIKRFAGIGYPLLTLNLGVSLARYIPLAPERSERFFTLGSGILTGSVLAAAGGAVMFRAELSVLLFGSEALGYLIIPALQFLYASGMQILSMGYLRGIQDFRRMNLVNGLFAVNALFALVIFAFGGEQDLGNYFTLYTVINLSLNILVLRGPQREGRLAKGSRTGAAAETGGGQERAYILYGVSRIPSVFFIVGLFSLPVFYSSSQISLEAAATVGLVISIANIYQTLGLPFNLLILPGTSDLSAKNDREGIRRNAGNVLDFFFTLPLLSISLIILLAPEVVQLWFGEKYLDMVPYLNLFAPASAFIILYSLLRGMIDGIEDFPWINIITSSAFAVLILSYLFLDRFEDILMGLVAGFSVSLFVLGGTTAAVLKRQTGVQIFSRRNMLSALLAMVWIPAALGMNRLQGDLGFWILGVLKLSLAGGVLGISVWVYRKLEYDWVGMLIRGRRV